MNTTIRTTMLLIIVVSLTLASASFAVTVGWKGFTWTGTAFASVMEVLPDGNLHTVHQVPGQAVQVAYSTFADGRALTEVSFKDLGLNKDSHYVIFAAYSPSTYQYYDLYVSYRPYEAVYSYENLRSGIYTSFGTRTAGIHTFRLLRKSDSAIEVYLDGILVHTDNYFKNNGISFHFMKATLGGYGMTGGTGADNIWTDFKALSEGELSASVTGRVILSGFDTVSQWWTTAIGVEFIQNGSVVQRETVFIDSDGDFTVANVPVGTYNIALKGSQFLRKVSPGVVVNGPTQIAPVTLVNGDLDGDNQITTTDLSIPLIPGVGAKGDQYTVNPSFPTSIADPGVAIVAGAECLAAANTLSDNIEAAVGITLPVISDVEAVANRANYSHLVALGQYGNNKLIERLYYRWYVVVDGAQPGKGGYTLQTVCKPEGLTSNVIIVGGSDSAGVTTACARFVERIRISGTTLPRLFEVEMGAGKDLVLVRGDEVLNPNRVWPTVHPMEIQQAIAEVGMLYVYTGQERFAAKYKERLMLWLQAATQASISDDFSRTIIVWDLLEESSVFNDEERLWIRNKLWEVLQREHAPYPGGGTPNYNYEGFMQVKDQPVLRANHHARYANSIYFGARYFKQYQDVQQMNQWMDEVHTFWTPQMSSFATQEGLFSMAMITLTEAATYALAEGNTTFLSTDVLGRIADKGQMLTMGSSYLGGGATPSLMWCLAAHMFDKPEYLSSFYPSDLTLSAIRMPWRSSGGWEVGRSFWDGREPTAPAATSQWVTAMPTAVQFYADSPAHGPKNVPQSQSFDFLVFREPGGTEYLAVDGHNTGSYSRDAANSITEFYSRGKIWLTGGGHVSTVNHHSSVSVVKDGRGQALPAYARLDRAESTPDWGISGSTLLEYNGTDWRRSILSAPAEWYLVVDEVTARESNDFTLENRWKGYSPGGFDGEDFVFIQQQGAGQLEFRLTGTGWDSQYLVPWYLCDYLASPIHPFPPNAGEINLQLQAHKYEILAKRWSGHLNNGESHVFANLFYVHPRDGQKPYTLSKLSDRHYLIEGDDADWEAECDAGGTWSLTEISQQALAALLGSVSQPQATISAASAATSIWSKQEQARVLSSVALRVDGNTMWAVGLADGHIHLYQDDGDAAGVLDMPGMVLALAAMDLDGDGDDELVAGSDTGGVRAFTASGTALWTFTPPVPAPNPSWRETMGVMRTVITDIAPIDVVGDSRPEILASGLFFYVLDSNGGLISKYDDVGELSFTDLVGIKGQKIARTPENTLVLAAGDVDGDNRPEIAGDINDPGYSYVRIWEANNGSRKANYLKPSDRYLSNAIKSVVAADIDGDGKDEFAVGADSYLNHLSLFGYPEGLLWSRNLAGSVECITSADLNNNGTAEIVVGTELGHVQAFDRYGNRLFAADAVGPVACVKAATGIRKEIWAGTLNGKLMVLDYQGNLLREGSLPGYIDHLALDADQQKILVTTAEGSVALYAVGGP